MSKTLIVIGQIKKVLFVSCLFISPLFFLTDTTQNPFAIQPLMFALLGGFFLLLSAVEIFLKGEVNLKISRADIFFLLFIFCVILSSLVNYFEDFSSAILNEVLRKADYFIFGSIFAFLFSKIVCKFDVVPNLTAQFLCKIFYWSLLWFLWLIWPSYFLGFAIFCVGVWLCFKHFKEGSVLEVIDILIAVSVLAAMYGILQNLGFDLFWKLDISYEFGPRAVSTFGNPNFLSSYILLFIPVTLIFFLQAKSKKEIFIFSFCLIVFSIFLAISGARSAWLGVFGSAIIFILFSKNFRVLICKKWLHFLLLMIVLVSAFCLWPKNIRSDLSSFTISRISEVKNVKTLKDFSLNSDNLTPAIHQRLMMWSCALNNVKNAPILGNGLNTFQLLFAPCQGALTTKNPSLDKIKTQANAVHNEILEVLSDTGILGTIVFLLLLSFGFISAIRKMDGATVEEKLFYFALLLGLFSVLIDNLLNITLRTLLVSFAFWFIFWLCSNWGGKVKKIKINKIFSFLNFICVLVLVFLLFTWQLRVFRAQVYELKGYKSFVRGDYIEAVNLMDKTLKLSTSRAEPFYNLINSLVKLGRFNEAEIVSREAIKYYPNYFEFYFRLAALSQEKGQNKDALENLRKTLTLYPSYSPAAEVYSSLLLYGSKIKVEDKTLLKTLSVVQFYNTNLKAILAQVYFNEGNFETAQILSEEVLNQNPFDVQTLELLQKCLEQTGAPKAEVLDISKKVISFKTRLKTPDTDKKLESDLITFVEQKEYPQFAASLLAEFYFKTQKPCIALDILRPYVQERMQTKPFNFAIASAAVACGEKEIASKYLHQILEVDPYDELAQKRLNKLS